MVIFMDMITIVDETGNKKQMEVCLTFKLANCLDSYVIYSELDKSHYYIGKYMEDMMNIDTILTNEEYQLCESIFERVVGENVRD